MSKAIIDSALVWSSPVSKCSKEIANKEVRHLLCHELMTNIISQNWGLTWAKREQLWQLFNFCNQSLNSLKTVFSFTTNPTIYIIGYTAIQGRWPCGSSRTYYDIEANLVSPYEVRLRLNRHTNQVTKEQGTTTRCQELLHSKLLLIVWRVDVEWARKRRWTAYL